MNREGALTVGSRAESAEDTQVNVVVHPLVLLSTVDHYTRVAKDTRKRVVGVLLGTRSKGTVDVTNSFAVPFEEDLKNPAIWFLDHNYLETMYRMYKKVNAREQIVGFYSSGPKIKENDIRIDELLRKYCTTPVFVIIDVPPTAYVSVEEVTDKAVVRTFKHVTSSIGAYEAEEVGVEHLLRDVNDPTISTLASQIQGKLDGLKAMRGRLKETKDYLQAVLNTGLPVNNQILYNLQMIFNLLPNLSVVAKSMLVKTNDMHLAIYCAALVRCIIALHDLVNNKIATKDDTLNNIAPPKDDGISTTKDPATSNDSSQPAASNTKLPKDDDAKKAPGKEDPSP